MKQGIYAERSTGREAAFHLSNNFYLDCLSALGGIEAEEAAMVLDDRGEVLFCNSKGASIFNSDPHKLVGKHLSDFVLNVRLNPWTPSGNVAHAEFSGKRRHWREYCVLDAAGHGFPVEILMDVRLASLRYLILLWVRLPAKPNEH